MPSGALAPALEAAFVIGAPHQIEGKVAHNRHVLGPVALAQAWLESLKAHVLASVTAYTFAKHLKRLRWRTPFQAIC